MTCVHNYIDDHWTWDWYEFLGRASTNSVSNEDWSKANGLALSWPTCATGQLCKDLSRSPETGRPKDPMLSDLGFEFYDAIAARTPAAALLIMERIEQRTAQLLTSTETKL